MNQHLFDFPFLAGQLVVTPWKIVGVIGAVMFASRWLVQSYYSRKAGKPVTPPRAFWVLSVMGSLLTLAYFIFSPKQDMVGVIQNLIPCFTACYMLYLDLVHQKKVAKNQFQSITGSDLIHNADQRQEQTDYDKTHA